MILDKQEPVTMDARKRRCMRKAAFRVQSVEVRRDLRLPFLSAFLFVCHAATPDPELVQSLHLYATRDGP
jgi:hypothetical protein